MYIYTVWELRIFYGFYETQNSTITERTDLAVFKYVGQILNIGKLHSDEKFVHSAIYFIFYKRR